MKQHFASLKGDTLRAIVLVCLAVGIVGMSYGSLAVAYGFPIWVPFVLSVCVLAGASEFMFIGIVASGGNPLAAAAAGLLVNARHIPFGVTVRDLVGQRAASFLGCHIMNDESVVFGLSQKTPEQRRAAYWLCGLGVALIWPLGALLGAGVGKLLPAPETIGLDAVFCVRKPRHACAMGLDLYTQWWKQMTMAPLEQQHGRDDHAQTCKQEVQAATERCEVAATGDEEQTENQHT